MMKLTWDDIRARISQMSMEELAQTATVYDNVWDEMFPVERIGISEAGDDVAEGVLDPGHLYMQIGDLNAPLDEYPRNDDVQACLTDLKALVDARPGPITQMAIDVILGLQTRLGVHALQALEAVQALEGYKKGTFFEDLALVRRFRGIVPLDAREKDIHDAALVIIDLMAKAAMDVTVMEEAMRTSVEINKDLLTVDTSGVCMCCLDSLEKQIALIDIDVDTRLKCSHCKRAFVLSQTQEAHFVPEDRK